MILKLEAFMICGDPSILSEQKEQPEGVLRSRRLGNTIGW